MFNSVKYVKYFQVFAINSAIMSIPDITLTWISFAAVIRYTGLKLDVFLWSIDN